MKKRVNTSPQLVLQIKAVAAILIVGVATAIVIAATAVIVIAIAKAIGVTTLLATKLTTRKREKPKKPQQRWPIDQKKQRTTL